MSQRELENHVKSGNQKVLELVRLTNDKPDICPVCESSQATCRGTRTLDRAEVSKHQTCVNRKKSVPFWTVCQKKVQVDYNRQICP